MLADYRHSPHLAQWALYDRLVGIVHETIRGVEGDGLPLRVLEIGAGHGGYTDSLLAGGCEVTVAEMSRPSVEFLRSRYGLNDRLTLIFDPNLGLADVGEGFSLVVCVSLLHHVPDYLAILGRIIERIGPGGAILLLEEPLWYPRLDRLTRVLDRGAYLTWRLGQGRIREGLASMRRRFRGIPLEAERDQIVYYHVVRQGVDERAVCRFLAHRFVRVEPFCYWSNHLAAIHRPAERMRLKNTFGIRAVGSSSDRQRAHDGTAESD
jgi:SAM-dependent methyltransferase